MLAFCQVNVLNEYDDDDEQHSTQQQHHICHRWQKVSKTCTNNNNRVTTKTSNHSSTVQGLHLFMTSGQVTMLPVYSLSAWSLLYYPPATYIFGPSGLNLAFSLDFGLRPQFLALLASSQSVISIHSTACCSVTATYKDADDALLWWWHLYDVTANCIHCELLTDIDRASVHNPVR